VVAPNRWVIVSRRSEWPRPGAVFASPAMGAGSGARIKGPSTRRPGKFTNFGRVMLATFAERGGRAFVGRAERVVEAAHAAEASREGNLGERHLGAVDQALGCLDAARRRDFAR